MTTGRRLKVLIFVVAYNAERQITDVLRRIPPKLGETYDLHLLLIDDCSSDHTAAVARAHLAEHSWYDYKVLRNPVNQGYGGNQKIGYHYAVVKGFDVVALLHGDGQYAPECLPLLLEPFSRPDPPDAVFGSRMLHWREALKGGMPLYKLLGNRVLTGLQNRLLDSYLSEFHSGYRVYSVEMLRLLPFELNTNDFHFDTEIIVQLFFAQARVVELPIPTFYGDEVCHVNGFRYAWNVSKASIKARLIRKGIFFDPKFATTGSRSGRYVSKFDFVSTHSLAFEQIPAGSVVLDLGCADGYFSERLHLAKGCRVYSVDVDEGRSIAGCAYQACDLNTALPDVPWEELDVVVLLDVIEHLNDPELFLERLRLKLSGNDTVQVIVSSGNVCFFVTRLMVLLGQFNYGQRGILDITHRRLFTVKSLERVLRYEAYSILRRRSVPGPYPLALGLNTLSKVLVAANDILGRLLPGLFAYQALFVVQPRPSPEWLLQQADSGLASADAISSERLRGAPRDAMAPGARLPRRRGR